MTRHSPTVFDRTTWPDSLLDSALAPSRPAVPWIEDLGARAERPRLRSAMRTDLVIVGGGLTGLWTAVRAKRRDPGRRVVLLEAKRIGWAASGRNGGFCDASLTHGAENGRSRWPEEFETLERLGLENLAGFERDLEELTVDAEFERVGGLDVATEEHQLEWLDDMANEPGRHRVTALGARALVDSPTYLGGVVTSGDSLALVHPGKLSEGLARAAEELGVEIFEHSPATGLDADGDRMVVRTAQGSVTAERVALATNAFPSLLVRDRLMTVPVYDYVLMTEPLTAAQRESIGWLGRQGLGDVANQFHYYRLTRDHRILFGGYDAVYFAGGRIRESYEDRPASFRKLASHFFTTFPQLEEVRFAHRWAGPIDTSTRFCAYVRLARAGRVAAALGFTGLGVGASRFAAEVMLDRLDGLQTERTETRMMRELPPPFPPEPIASMGIQATRWSLDQADHRGGRRNLLLRTLDALGLGFDS